MANKYFEISYSLNKNEINIFNYVNILTKIALFKDARYVLVECINIDNVSSIYKAWCSNQLGLIYEHGKAGEISLQNAITYYKLAYKYNDSDFYNLYNLAMIYYKVKDESIENA